MYIPHVYYITVVLAHDQQIRIAWFSDEHAEQLLLYAVIGLRKKKNGRPFQSKVQLYYTACPTET